MSRDVSSQGCAASHCPDRTSLFGGRFRRRTRPGFVVGASWYCGEGCLRQGLATILEALAQGRSRGVSVERSLRPTLGLLLMEQGKLTKEQLDHALEVQQHKPGLRIGELLVELGSVSEREVTQALSRQFAVPWVNFVKGQLSPAVRSLIPAVVARTYSVVPVDHQAAAGRILVAIVGPPDYAFVNGLSRMLELDVAVLVADASRLAQLIDQFYPESKAAERLMELGTVDAAALTDLIATQAERYSAEELRLERCGARLWLRLIKDDKRLDLLLDVDLPEESEVYAS